VHSQQIIPTTSLSSPWRLTIVVVIVIINFIDVDFSFVPCDGQEYFFNRIFADRQLLTRDI
jgi:hypothetical protein